MPTESVSVSGLWDYAVTKDQTLRVGFGKTTSTSKNQGVGAYDLLERAYSAESQTFSLRVQEAGPLGRRFFTNTRFALIWSDTDSRSVAEQPTVVLLLEPAGGRLPAGRHPDQQEPHAEPGRAGRGADAPRRLREHRAADRHHVVAVQEREDDAPGERRPVLRLAGVRRVDLSVGFNF